MEKHEVMEEDEFKKKIAYYDKKITYYENKVGKKRKEIDDILEKHRKSIGKSNDSIRKYRSLRCGLKWANSYRNRIVVLLKKEPKEGGWKKKEILERFGMNSQYLSEILKYEISIRGSLERVSIGHYAHKSLLGFKRDEETMDRCRSCGVKNCYKYIHGCEDYLSMYPMIFIKREI